MKYNKGLDTFRAFAVIFVIIQHWGPPFNDKTALGKFAATFFIPDGGTGVYMFFVLSGFLITGNLLHARLEAGDGNRLLTVKNFFGRRILRIFPVYYITLFLVAQSHLYPDLVENIWYFITYTSNILCYRLNSFGPFSQTWTLSIEEQFYIFWPWLILFINWRYLKYLFAAAIAIGFATTLWEVKVHNHIIPYLAYNCVDALAHGGFYAYARLDSAYCARFEKMVRILAPAFLCMFLLRKFAMYQGDNYYLVSVKKSVDSFLSLWIIIWIMNCRSRSSQKNTCWKTKCSFLLAKLVTASTSSTPMQTLSTTELYHLYSAHFQPAPPSQVSCLADVRCFV